MKLIVTQIVDRAVGIKSFVLRGENGAVLPAFEPGAHVSLRIQVNGSELHAKYSLISDPAQRDTYEIAVGLNPPPHPGLSRYLHERVAVGDLLGADGPYNAFRWNRSAEHSVFIAGGIGITPILSFLRVCAQEGASFELHYAARSRESCAFLDEIGAFAPQQGRFYFSDRDERLDLPALLAEPVSGKHVYACGPHRLIDSVRLDALRLGWKAQNIHIESFGARWSATDQPVELRLAQSGLTLNVAPGQTLLEAMLEAGVFTSYECQRGECGQCFADVTEGEVDHRDVCLDAEQRRRGLCTCVSWAKGETLELDL